MRTTWAIAFAALTPSLPEAPEPLVEVAVAAVALDPGVEVRPDDVRAVWLPASRVPDDALPVDRVVGRAPWERVLDGEIVRDARLPDLGAGVGVNAMVPRGRVAAVVQSRIVVPAEIWTNVNVMALNGEVLVDDAVVIAWWRDQRAVAVAVTPEQAELLADPDNPPHGIDTGADRCCYPLIDDDDAWGTW